MLELVVVELSKGVFLVKIQIPLFSPSFTFNERPPPHPSCLPSYSKDVVYHFLFLFFVSCIRSQSRRTWMEKRLREDERRRTIPLNFLTSTSTDFSTRRLEPSFPHLHIREYMRCKKSRSRFQVFSFFFFKNPIIRNITYKLSVCSIRIQNLIGLSKFGSSVAWRFGSNLLLSTSSCVLCKIREPCPH